MKILADIEAWDLLTPSHRGGKISTRTEVDMMEEKRAMTVRLDADQAEVLEALASVEGSAIADEIRKAITMHIEKKKKDKAFQSRLRESLRRNEAILERLADR